MANGRGQIETEGRYADFTLQLDVFVNGKTLNSGVFYRCIPGEQMNGYETQTLRCTPNRVGNAHRGSARATPSTPAHHFIGCRPGSGVNQMWHELGALPRELVKIEACTAVASPDGKMFVDYYDLAKLKETLIKLSPADAKAIDRYIGAIKAFDNDKVDDAINSGSFWKMITILPWMLSNGKWMKMNMRTYA